MLQDSQPRPEVGGWIRSFERSIEHVGRAVSWLSLGMAAGTVLVVVLRYAGVGSVALQESVAYMHAALFTLGASYTLQCDGHVRVDVLYRGWSPRTQALIDLLGTVLLLGPFCVYVGVKSVRYVASSWSILEGSPEAGGLPAVFLLKTLIPLMVLLLGVAGLCRAGRLVVRLRGCR